MRINYEKMRELVEVNGEGHVKVIALREGVVNSEDFMRINLGELPKDQIYGFSIHSMVYTNQTHKDIRGMMSEERAKGLELYIQKRREVNN